MWRCGWPVPLSNVGCKSLVLFHLFFWGWVHWDLYKNYFKTLFFILNHRCFMHTKHVLKGVSCRCRGKNWGTSRAEPAWAHCISVEVLHPLLGGLDLDLFNCIAEMIWVAFVFALRLACALFSLFPTSAFDFWTKHRTSVNQSEFCLSNPFTSVANSISAKLFLLKNNNDAQHHGFTLLW